MKKEYTVLGAWCLSAYGGLELLAIDRYDEKVLTRFTGGRKVWSSLRVDRYGRDYIYRSGCKYYLDECMAIVH